MTLLLSNGCLHCVGFGLYGKSADAELRIDWTKLDLACFGAGITHVAAGNTHAAAVRVSQRTYTYFNLLIKLRDSW
jgi:hypothetical protein